VRAGFTDCVGAKTRRVLTISCRLQALKHDVTVPDTYPLPWMDKCIDSVGDAVVFTTLDCNSRYWQIPVDPVDHEKRHLRPIMV
jgi:hypothetical protein